MPGGPDEIRAFLRRGFWFLNWRDVRCLPDARELSWSSCWRSPNATTLTPGMRWLMLYWRMRLPVAAGISVPTNLQWFPKGTPLPQGTHSILVTLDSYLEKIIGGGGCYFGEQSPSRINIGGGVFSTKHLCITRMAWLKALKAKTTTRLSAGVPGGILKLAYTTDSAKTRFADFMKRAARYARANAG